MSDLSDDGACLSRTGEIVDDDSVVEVEVTVVDEELEPVRNTGRSQSMVWGYFTDVVQPQKLKQRRANILSIIKKRVSLR